jgi:hypothetical protein
MGFYGNVIVQDNVARDNIEILKTVIANLDLSENQTFEDMVLSILNNSEFKIDNTELGINPEEEVE